MTSNKFFKSLLAISLSSALLVTGCSSELPAQNAGQPDEMDFSETTAEEVSAEESTTEETTAEETTAAPLQLGDRTGDCFIAPEFSIYYEDIVDSYQSYDCEPGYLYFKKGVFGEIKLLLDKKFKFGYHIQTANEFYALTEENELLKVNKLDGSYDVLYAAKSDDAVLRFSSFVVNKNGDPGEEGKLLYLLDGDDLIIMERETEEYDILHSDNGIKNFWFAGYQECEIYNGNEAYICDICGYDGNYVIWEDNDENYFWYHPETGENEPLKMIVKYLEYYFVQAE